MKKRFILMIIAGSLILYSCMRHRDDGKMCTTEYRMCTISITDQQSNPVILTAYFLQKTSTGEIIDFLHEDPYTDSINRQQGIYFICTDRMMGITSVKGTEFVFHGIKDTTEIVNEPYIIGNDECHVYVVSGKTKIIITK